MNVYLREEQGCLWERLWRRRRKGRKGKVGGRTQPRSLSPMKDVAVSTQEEEAEKGLSRLILFWERVGYASGWMGLCLLPWIWVGSLKLSVWGTGRVLQVQRRPPSFLQRWSFWTDAEIWRAWWIWLITQPYPCCMMGVGVRLQENGVWVHRGSLVYIW